MTLLLIVHLDAKSAARLDKPVNGRGGFQGLLRYMQGHRMHNTVIFTDPVWIERLGRYATTYGDGGFERRLRSGQ